MEAKIVDRGLIIVAGVERVFDPTRDTSALFNELWEKEFWPQYGRISALCEDEGFYGVWSGDVGAATASYLAGAAVRDSEGVPETMVVRRLPGARYAVFECTVGTIGETYAKLFKGGKPGSWPKLDQTAPHFEYYPPGTSGADSPVFIHVPVAPDRC